ncbi:hypothetical protein A6R68_14367 [Neotoma lepida]|uniref:Uncharacterized protein n=1 Tax=Neotoma lepida TaxID=56216 RepID=A0A1A6HA03_NEOLE|nr:hypothetical protein A6R68_14367 [Neotoma lepida]
MPHRTLNKDGSPNLGFICLICKGCSLHEVVSCRTEIPLVISYRTSPSLTSLDVSAQGLLEMLS